MSLIVGTPTSRGKQIAAAVKKAYDLTGSSYYYRRSGSSYIVKGKLVLSDFADFASRFEATETATWKKPAYVLKVAGEFLPAGAPLVGDTCDLPSSNRSSSGASEFASYTVRGIFYDFIGDVVVSTRVYLARLS